jgi:hypothetical protein
MISRLRGRRHARAFQQALERYERALAEGKDRKAAYREVSAVLGADARLLSLATNMASAHAPAPEPRYVEMFATKLRNTEIRTRPRLVRRPKLGLAPIALAACTVILAGVMIPSLQSLPGDRLYPVKSASEDARVWFASGPAEAKVRIGLAHERFFEVEQLIERAEIEALAVASVMGQRDIAAGVAEIDDPELAKLIDSTLAEASEHIETAAKILIAQPAPAIDLDELVAISQRGRELAAEVVEDLPNADHAPVLGTAVKLAKIEAKAKAARMSAEPAPTPPRCATPTPTPTPDPDAPPDGSLETATPTVVESPSPEPTESPEPTPCVSPSPTPTPTPTPTPSPDPNAGAQPTAEPESENGENASPVEVSGSEDNGHGSGGDGTPDA